MKELSIEEEAKRYNEALDRAKAAHKDEDRHLKATLERIFPELKEKDSEDERIRKWCISHFRECFRVTKDNVEYQEYLNNKVIPWLEKQGEQEILCDKCRKEHPSHSCQDITELGRCAVEYEQKSAWSQEDESMFECIKWSLVDLEVKEQSMGKFGQEIAWLKSLKDRIQRK
jgi:hypothetical protein